MPEDTDKTIPEETKPPESPEPLTEDKPENKEPPAALHPVGKLSAENKALAKTGKIKDNLRVDEVDQSPTIPPVEPHLLMELQDPEIMGTDIRAVAQDLKLVERGLAEFQRQYQELSRRKSDIDKKLLAIGKRSAGLGKLQLILQKTQIQSGPSEQVKRFQKQSMEQRARKVKNAQEFLKHGTTPDALKKLINPKSPIDQGFAGRKPGIGQGRPGQRLPARI